MCRKYVVNLLSRYSRGDVCCYGNSFETGVNKKSSSEVFWNPTFCETEYMEAPCHHRFDTVQNGHNISIWKFVRYSRGPRA